MAVGVGVVLARAGRELIDERTRRRERELALHPGARLGAELQRMALGQVDLALELLTVENGRLDEHAVHETRKALKRLRALVRLLVGELGQQTCARENAALREIGARLSGARDAEVLLATLDALIKRHPRRLGSKGVRRLRKHLAVDHARMERAVLGDPQLRAEVRAELQRFRARAALWSLADAGRDRLVEPGLTRIYAQGRRRMRRVGGGNRRRTRALHEWRKRVKDLRYAAEMLQPTRKAGALARHNGAARRDERARRLREIERRADKLGEALGEDHDLAVLAGVVAGSQQLRGRDRRRLAKLIAARRRALQDRALRDGSRLYRRPPQRFVRRVRPPGG